MKYTRPIQIYNDLKVIGRNGTHRADAWTS